MSSRGEGSGVDTRTRRSRSRATAAILVVLVVAVVTIVIGLGHGGTPGGTIVRPASGTTYPSGQTLSGVVTNQPAKAEPFGTWRGKPVDVLVSYVGTRTWDGATQVDKEGLLGGVPDSVRRVYSIPLIPSAAGATLVSGAAGDYDHYFRTLGQNLVRGGEAGATLRIGWEMTGDWFPWNGVRQPGVWVGAYRSAVTAMRSVKGQHFTFEWTVAAGFADPGPLYPGDAYVDLVGMDVYDVSFSTGYKATDHARVWNALLTKRYGLTWLARFSAAHGKRIAFSEWGLSDRCDGHGGGDDPEFIQHMDDWMRGHDVAYEAYFNGSDPSICATFAVDSGRFPLAAARYRQLFGAGASSPGVSSPGASAVPPGSSAVPFNPSDGASAPGTIPPGPLVPAS